MRRTGGVAHGAGLAIFAVDGHLFVEGGDFVGETVAHFLKKQRLPSGQGFEGGVVEHVHFLVSQLGGVFARG